MTTSLVTRIALLVAALTMLSVTIATAAILFTTQKSLQAQLEARQIEINSIIIKTMNEAASTAQTWHECSDTATQLSTTYGVRIAVTNQTGDILLDTGSGSLPPATGQVKPDPVSGGSGVTNSGDNNTLGLGPATIHIGSLADPKFPLSLIAVIFSCVTLVSGVIALILGRGLTRPLSRVGEVVESIREGDLTARVTVAGPSEISALATGVNGMADALLTSAQQRMQFTADIAHELRSPLTTIRSHIDAFLDGVLDFSVDNLAAVDEETERLSRLVDELAVMASLDEGTLRLHKSATDLEKLADSALDARRAAASTAQITLTRRGHAPVLVVDADRISQIMSNVLDNAIRHTPQGGLVTIDLETSSEAVLIRVTDSGPGIAPEHLSRIFDRLWRADQARGHEGAHGLGLAIARGLAIAHGGDIDVINAAGGGCTFTVTLPRTTGSEAIAQ